MKNTSSRPCAQELSWCSSESLKLLLFAVCESQMGFLPPNHAPRALAELMPLLPLPALRAGLSVKWESD